MKRFHKSNFRFRLAAKPAKLRRSPAKFAATALCALKIAAVGIAALEFTALGSGLPVARADYVEPGSVMVKTERYIPDNTDFDRGTYHYQVSWQGIPVAKAEVDVDLTAKPVRGLRLAENQTLYRVAANAKTGSFIDVFYKLRFSSESLFDSTSLRPVLFSSVQKENSKEKRRTVSFGDDGTIYASYIKNGDVKDPILFKSQNSTLDPISAAFVARSLPITLGAKKSFDVFNGKHRYLITFTVKAKEKIKIAGKTYDSFRVEPAVKKLTDTEGEKRLEYATIWITADDSRRVLKLESKVLVGKVDATLVKFVPKTNSQIKVAHAALSSAVQSK